MGAFYGSKILSGKINPRTGQGWRTEDIPSLWKDATEKWLKDNS